MVRGVSGASESWEGVRLVEGDGDERAGLILGSCSKWGGGGGLLYLLLQSVKILMGEGMPFTTLPKYCHGEESEIRRREEEATCLAKHTK